jgi:uncharacterized membrane protein
MEQAMMWGYSTYDNPAMLMWVVVEAMLRLAFVGLANWALIHWLGRSSYLTIGTTSSIPTNAPQALSALDVLKQRYARSEIDAATFMEMRAHLEASDQSAGQIHEPVTSGR